MAPDGRFVWMTRKQRDTIEYGDVQDLYMLVREFRSGYDSAPSDPAGEVEMAIFAYDFPQTRRPWTMQEREEYAARADLVIRALWGGDA